jgi:hypothetical protein
VHSRRRPDDDRRHPDRGQRIWRGPRRPSARHPAALRDQHDSAEPRPYDADADANHDHDHDHDVTEADHEHDLADPDVPATIDSCARFGSGIDSSDAASVDAASEPDIPGRVAKHQRHSIGSARGGRRGGQRGGSE